MSSCHLVFVTALTLSLTKAWVRNQDTSGRCDKHQIISGKKIHCKASAEWDKEHECARAFDGYLWSNKKGSAWSAKGHTAWIEAYLDKTYIIEEVRILQRFDVRDNVKKISIAGIRGAINLPFMGSKKWNVIKLKSPLSTNKIKIYLLESNSVNHLGNVGFKEIYFIGCPGVCKSFQNLPENLITCEASSKYSKLYGCEKAFKVEKGNSDWAIRGKKDAWITAKFKQPAILTDIYIRQRKNANDVVKTIEIQVDGYHLMTSSLKHMSSNEWNRVKLNSPITASTVKIIVLETNNNKPGNVGFRDIVFHGCLQDKNKATSLCEINVHRDYASTSVCKIFLGNQYKVKHMNNLHCGSKLMTWLQAKTYCEGAKKVLAMPKSSAHVTEINACTKKGPVWIGAHKFNSKSFTYMDRTPVRTSIGLSPGVKGECLTVQKAKLVPSLCSKKYFPACQDTPENWSTN